MIVNDIVELSVAAVLNRGEPNQECIAIQVHSPINVGQYGIMVGVFHHQTGMAMPLMDNLFWFGDADVKPQDWIFVNTGLGQANSGKLSDNTGDYYSVFWGRKQTMFANSNLVPILFRVDAVVMPKPPADKPQLPALA
jgi:hypothetical protein